MTQSNLLQDKFDVGGRTRNITFQLAFCSNVAKQVACVCFPFYRSLNLSEIEMVEIS